MPPARKPSGRKGAETAQSGVLWYPSGDIYSGDYLADGASDRVRYGTGTYTVFCEASRTHPALPKEVAEQPLLEGYPHDIVVFHGEWESDHFVKGEITFRNGAKYSGSFDAEGLYVSGGRYTWPSGCWYEGAWHKNMIHGSGTFGHPNGEVYEGIFRNNFGPGMEALHNR